MRQPDPLRPAFSWTGLTVEGWLDKESLQVGEQPGRPRLGWQDWNIRPLSSLVSTRHRCLFRHWLACQTLRSRFEQAIDWNEASESGFSFHFAMKCFRSIIRLSVWIWI